MLMRFHEIISEVDLSRRGFLKGLGAASLAGAAGYAAMKPDAEKPAAPAVATTDQPEVPTKDADMGDMNKFIKDLEPGSPDAKKMIQQYGSTSKYANSQEQNKLANYAQKHGVKGLELAALLAQAAHETLSFTGLVERGDKTYFKKYDGKLGNDKPGDGYKYRGRGYIHITGKYNYALVGKALGLDLLKHPELMERTDVALKASMWYWNTRVRPGVKDWNDVRAVTYRVNGGYIGLDDREANFADYKRKLKV